MWQRTACLPGATSSRTMSPGLTDAAGISSTTTTYPRLRSARRPSARWISTTAGLPDACGGSIGCRCLTVPACRCMTKGSIRERAKPNRRTVHAQVSHSHSPVAIAAPVMSSERAAAPDRNANPRATDRLSTRPCVPEPQLRSTRRRRRRRSLLRRFATFVTPVGSPFLERRLSAATSTAAAVRTSDRSCGLPSATLANPADVDRQLRRSAGSRPRRSRGATAALAPRRHDR